MFDICLLFPEKSKRVTRNYGMSQDMIKDLNLTVILKAMAKEDEYLYSACQRVMMTPIGSKEVLKFRQDMVMDAARQKEFYEEAYRLAASAMKELEKNVGQKQERSHMVQIYDALQTLLVLLKYMKRLKNHLLGDQAEQAPGMLRFTTAFREYYTDEFIEDMWDMVENMAVLMQGGRLVLTAGIGGGMKCGDAMINRLEPFDYRKMGFFRKSLRKIVHTFFSPETIELSDTALKHEASQMEQNGLHYTLQICQNFIREFRDFFEQFRSQIAFYVGCANLHRTLKHLGMQVTVPLVSRDSGKEKDSSGEKRLDYRKLYELSMALQTLKNPVDNSLEDTCHLHVVSGANQGGKSTFLRSVGIAQVLMQAGMFVPAEYFKSPLYDNILTHFTRREDSSMNSGRLVEEMKRMNRIVDMVTPDSLLLLNESFSSTTEKEGSQIAENIIQAFYDKKVSVFMVTHLFAFSSKMYGKELPHARFMSAERKQDGTRTFKILDHEPTETSYGFDLYEEIIGRLDGGE